MRKPPTKQRGTLNYFRQSRWSELNRRTINGTSPRTNGSNFHDYIKRGIELRMSKADFWMWCSENWNIAEKIIAEGDTPSIDRINSHGHYSIDNIRIVSLSENCAKGRQTRVDKTAKPFINSGLVTMLCAQVKARSRLRKLNFRLFAAINTAIRNEREEILGGKRMSELEEIVL